MTVNLLCPVCQKAVIKELRKYDFSVLSTQRKRTKLLLKVYLDNFNETGVVAVNQCQRCSFIWTTPRLSEQDLSQKYQLISDFDLGSRTGRPPHLEERRGRIVSLVSSLLGERKGANVLDYGGAEGYLLSPLIDQGYKGYLVDYIDYQREDTRINYLGRSLEEVHFEGRKFDLIFVLHTLEHVSDPVALLRRLSEFLAPEGKLYVEVPLGVWLEWQNLREPLTHINFFGEESLAEVALQAGLSVASVGTTWQYVTHPEKTPCVNLVAGKQFKTASPPPLSGAKQMKALSQGWKPLSQNARFYGKLIARNLFNS